MFLRVAVAIFFSLCLVTTEAWAQKQESQPVSGSEKTDPTASGEPEESLPSLSPEELQAQADLEEIKSRPQEYRLLVLGVQIFLGRFGYGTGPYTGKVDEKTQAALRGYQKYVGLQETGDIDFATLKHLTEDNKILDQPLPFLPKASFNFEQWDKAIRVQGTWAAQSGLTEDAIQTSRIFCFRKDKQCIEATGVLFKGSVPVLDVLVHVYSIKEWDEDKLVSAPYDGEPCTISILRMSRKQKNVTRFVTYQQAAGICAAVQPKDVQYHLMNGPQVHAILKQEKAKETQRILRVEE